MKWVFLLALLTSVLPSWGSPITTYWPLPKFSLTERDGKNITLENFRGKVWVASFIFTHCSEQCPMIISSLKKLYAALKVKDPVVLVSFTVDPERDTPAVLTRYAKHLGIDSRQWLFLTGQQKGLRDLMEKGFKVSGGLPAHSARLALIDKGGQVRGFYDAMDGARMAALSQDIARLVAE